MCSKTLAYKIQMPGNYTEESIQHSEHSERLELRIKLVVVAWFMIHFTFLSGNIRMMCSEVCHPRCVFKL